MPDLYNSKIFETEDLSSQVNYCHTCKSSLCLREQVINLSLGYEEKMYCLTCLGDIENQSTDSILSRLKGYIHSRQCLSTEWVKYRNISFCPKVISCLPNICFGNDDTSLKVTNYLNLRGVTCPANYIKTKLFLDKLPPNSLLFVVLDDGTSVNSVKSSIVSDGYKIVDLQNLGIYWRLVIAKEF